MSKFEQTEAQKPADAVQMNQNLSSYFMERLPVAKMNADAKDPSIEDKIAGFHLLDDARTGKLLNKQEEKDMGLNVKRSYERNGVSTEVNVPNGIRVVAHETASRSEVSGDIRIDVKAPAHRNPDGQIVDGKGNVIAKTNSDASVTVDTGKGFVTVYPDGTIRKEFAHRLPNGDFKVDPMVAIDNGKEWVVKPERKH